MEVFRMWCNILQLRYDRGATASGSGSPKPEGEAAVEGDASTPTKESGRGFCEIQWPWWRGSTDSASKSSKSKVNFSTLIIFNTISYVVKVYNEEYFVKTLN